MEACTELVVERDRSGRSVLARSSCEVPLLFRVADHDGPALHLSWVNGAAGPLGGDRLRLHLRVGAGASVRVRSTGASMVQPSARGGRSTTEVRIELGEGSRLDWCPEPTISVRGSDHRTSTRIVADPSALARVVEQVSLGRHDEPGGRLALHQRAVVGERAVLDHELVLGDGPLAGPGAHGPGRAVLSALVLGRAPELRVEVTPSSAAAVLDLDGGAWLVSATAPDLRVLSAWLPAS
ncbi:MAG: urease accessory protein UreD [Acidimicrobiales bacterium]